jgi:hypothetical protein
VSLGLDGLDSLDQDEADHLHTLVGILGLADDDALATVAQLGG